MDAQSNKALIEWLGWMGALCLAFAPFVIDTFEGKLMAIVGLALLFLPVSYTHLTLPTIYSV